MDDWKLLRAFAEEGSETAFAELVRRYSGLVHSAARRQTRSPTLADDVTQTVFVILARKARSIRRATILGGWLYRATRFAAMDALKAETRRRIREETAMNASLSVESPENTTGQDRWGEIAPLLDELMAKLGDSDRLALILRFFERRTLEDVGSALHVSGGAANKRVHRAIEKLRKLFSRRGVILGGAGLGTLLLTNAAHAAPASLAPTLASIGAAKGAGAVASILALVHSTTNKLLFLKVRRALRLAALALIGTAMLVMPWRRTTDLVDAAFRSDRIASTVRFSQVRAMAVGPDDKVIVAGRIRVPGEAISLQVLRLNSDGRPDFGFQAPLERGQVESLAVQPDGKILLGGSFGSSAGATGVRRIVVRITPEGSVDPTFQPSDVTNGLARAVVTLPDGKIVVGGSFDGFVGSSSKGVVRLLNDGRQDPSFRPPSWNRASASGVAADLNSRILAWGSFVASNGRQYSLIRLLPDGALDETFVRNTWNIGRLSCAAVAADGRILVGIESSANLGDLVSGLIRLNADGTPDNHFRQASLPAAPRLSSDSMEVVLAGSSINAVKETADKKILIVGGFREIHAIRRNGVARLNHDGSLDLSLDPGDGIVGGRSASAFALETQSDGQILVGGSFTHFDRWECAGLVRLLPAEENSLRNRFWPVIGLHKTTSSSIHRPVGRDNLEKP